MTLTCFDVHYILLSAGNKSSSRLDYCNALCSVVVEDSSETTIGTDTAACSREMREYYLGDFLA